MSGNLFSILHVMGTTPSLAWYQRSSVWSLGIKQSIFVCLSGFVFWFFSKPNRWRWVSYFYLLSVVGLILTLIPSWGVRIQGASRWIELGIVRWQPSEWVKVGFCVWLPMLFYKVQTESKLRLLLWGLLALPFGIFLIQPDYGSFVILLLLILLFLFLNGLSLGVFAVFGLLSAIMLGVGILLATYRINRILAFLNPFEDPEGRGYQIIQALAAVVRGGIFGNSPLETLSSHLYLPEAHTDFSFAVFVEHWGLLGVLILLLTFVIVLYRGVQLAWVQKDRFQYSVVALLTFYLSSALGLSLWINLGLLPPKGMSVPFLSYGGSNLMAWAVVFGVLSSFESDYILKYESSK